MALTNTFTMDVYIDGSSLTGEQTNKVQFKLQDKSMGGNAWQSQVVAEVVIDAVDTWQTVEFDFIDASERTDIDQVVIQFNGENNSDNVTAYIDNLVSSTSPEPDPCDGVTGAPAIADDFDADSVDILEYAGDNAVVITVMDGAAIGGSGNVLEYVDNGGTYANVQLRTCNKFDMAVTNFFTMDVYIDGSSLTGEQTNKVQFKLQDKSMGGNAWQSQVVAEVAIDAVDTWQTVVFDFTGTEAMNREDFDQVVIQFNGENNSDNVTAYIDNLQSANALGLDTVNTTSNFTFFPNPVNNVLTIKAQASIDSVIVYNMLGQAVVRSTPNTNDSTVDMSALQTGAYFVQVSINKTLKTVRVIKN